MFCQICKTTRDRQHNCFVPVYCKNKKKKKNIVKVYVYDFETTDLQQNGILVPYYCIVHKFCILCSNDKFKDMTTSSSKCCRERCHRFLRNDCIQTFTDYFIEKSKDDSKSRWYAHNGSKFDPTFVKKFSMRL